MSKSTVKWEEYDEDGEFSTECSHNGVRVIIEGSEDVIDLMEVIVSIDGWEFVAEAPYEFRNLKSAKKAAEKLIEKLSSITK